MTFEEWLTQRRYSVIRNHRGLGADVWEKVEVSGLTLEAARKAEAQFEQAEQEAHPGTTSWQHDIFYRQLEGEPWTVDRTAQSPAPADPQQLTLFPEARR